MRKAAGAAATASAGACGGGAVTSARGTASRSETALYHCCQHWTRVRCIAGGSLLPASTGSTLPCANSPGALPPVLPLPPLELVVVLSLPPEVPPPEARPPSVVLVRSKPVSNSPEESYSCQPRWGRPCRGQTRLGRFLRTKTCLFRFWDGD